ncbi:MAG: sulfite exporter TauE/SafE family protein [Candidatus Lokiarchaeota archaeon]|nr:sulfite exporter TauE/SafE family protein [Candidatus Lokiarchaeota archaeon]
MDLFWDIIILAFIFESMDSMAGMGFGTALSPLLLLYGFSPLQVVPTILISETITGIIDTFFDHELGNVRYSFKPLNEATKFGLIFAFCGCIAIFASIIITYLAFHLPTIFIKAYVAILVVIMGGVAILKLIIKKDQQNKLNRKLLIGFSAIAGFNKGIGGGGYGPIITLGQIHSGIYEKSATAIVSFSESIVSIVGIFCFYLIQNFGIIVDLILLPSLFTGGFFAALISPYLVRVIPNKFWKYVIPIYGIGIGIFLIIKLFI